MAVREFIDLMPFTCNEIKGYKAPAFPITGTRLKYWSNDEVHQNSWNLDAELKSYFTCIN
jgi:hypothetical protein